MKKRGRGLSRGSVAICGVETSYCTESPSIGRGRPFRGAPRSPRAKTVRSDEEGYFCCLQASMSSELGTAERALVSEEEGNAWYTDRGYLVRQTWTLLVGRTSSQWPACAGSITRVLFEDEARTIPRHGAGPSLGSG
jgi:hypothetical protein